MGLPNLKEITNHGQTINEGKSSVIKGSIPPFIRRQWQCNRNLIYRYIRLNLNNHIARLQPTNCLFESSERECSQWTIDIAASFRSKTTSNSYTARPWMF